MSTRTILILGGIVVILAFGGGMALQKDRDGVDNPTPSPSASLTPSPSATPSATPTPVTHTIRRTADGVTPKTLTIRRGDTVVFLNETAVGFWPASDPHPVHTLCPGFDARRALGQGESYTLVFAQPRTCTYHDHVAPADAARQGTIIIQ